MSTLVELVRTKTGATIDDAIDERILQALGKASVPVQNLPVSWYRAPNGAVRRYGALALRRYAVEATDATDSVASLTFTDITGEEIEGCVIDADGTVTLTDDDLVTGVAVYATGRAYDVHAAAADIVAGMLAVAAKRFNFTRGDQRFEAGQVVTHLQTLLAELRRSRITRKRGEVVMRDQRC